MQTHAGSTFYNCRTLIFDLKVNTRRAAVVHYMSTKFGVDSSSHFPFRARTHRQSHRSNGLPYPLLSMGNRRVHLIC